MEPIANSVSSKCIHIGTAPLSQSPGVLSLPTHYLMCPEDTVRHLSVVKAWAQSQPNGAGIQGQLASRWLRSSLSFYSGTITPFVK